MSKGKNLLGEFRKELLEEWQKASALLPYEVYAEYRASPFRVLSPVIDVENHKKIVVSGRAVGKSTTITRYMEQMFMACTLRGLNTSENWELISTRT